MQDYGIIESFLKSMQKILFTFVGFGSVFKNSSSSSRMVPGFQK